MRTEAMANGVREDEQLREIEERPMYALFEFDSPVRAPRGPTHTASAALRRIVLNRSLRRYLENQITVSVYTQA